MIVHAEADQVGREADGFRNAYDRIDVEQHLLAEIHTEIFDLEGPVLRERGLSASAERGNDATAKENLRGSRRADSFR